MLAIRFWLETTTSEQKRIAYDSMTLLGDIGGLYDSFVIFLVPFVTLLVGDRITYHLLSLLFFVNRSREVPEESEDENNNSDPEAKKRRWKKWLNETKPYKPSLKTMLLHNNLIKILMCRFIRPNRIKSEEELILSQGIKKV